MKCKHCGTNLPDHHDSTTSICPRCGRDLAQQQDDRVAVARITSLAEVGYFADLLDSHNVPNEVYQHNDFSAIDGTWTTTFLLRVSAVHQQMATDLIRSEVDRGFSPEHAAGGSDGESPSNAAAWKPLLLVLMAGGLAYCAGRSAAPPRPRAATLESKLWEALTEHSEPLESRQAAPQRRRLRFDPNQEQIILEDDWDGDGRFEQQRIFVRGH